jgi:hypothetical protein
MPIESRNRYGQVRKDVYGKVTIFTEKGWTDYPPSARALIESAQLHGWTIKSDGLPTRTNADGDVIVAVLLVRLPDIDGGGFEIRVPWICEKTVFRIGRPLYQTDRHGWTDTASTLKDVQRIIFENPVRQSTTAGSVVTTRSH